MTREWLEANELKDLPSHVLDMGLEPRFYISLCGISPTYFLYKILVTCSTALVRSVLYLEKLWRVS